MACWREAYAHLLSTDFLRALDVNQRHQAWSRRLSTPGPGRHVVWMAEDNPRARAFYVRNGFAPDGAHKVEPAGENLSEVRLVR